MPARPESAYASFAARLLLLFWLIAMRADRLNTNSCLPQTIVDSVSRKACPMLRPGEALFFRGRYKLTITNKRRRRFRMKAIETKNDHLRMGSRRRCLFFFSDLSVMA